MYIGEEPKGVQKVKKGTLRIIAFIIFGIAVVLLTFIAVPIINSYKNPQEFKAYIEGFGSWSFVAMFAIQIAQIVVALIPGELVEFVAGTIYGGWGGLFFCLGGIAVGQTLIFYLVKILGRDFVEKVAGSKNLKRFKFLQDEKKLKSVIFFLFFIPGTPKDLITYIVPLTKIKFLDFLAISLVARIPSIVSSTFAGDAFSERKIVLLAIVYGIALTFTLIGVLIYRKWKIKHEN